MTDHLNHPIIEAEVESYFHQGTPRPAFVIGLRQELLSEAAHSPSHPAVKRPFHWPILHKPVWRYAFAGVLLLGLVVVALGPQRVLAAVEGWIGFLPGLGFVQNPNTAQVLDKPVSVTQGEVSVTVLDAVADDANTRMLLKAEGIRDLWKDVGSGNPDFFTPPPAPRLTYPGGSLNLDHTSQGKLGSNSVSLELVFPPLPKQAVDPVLIFQRIPGLRKELAPENWSIPLHLKTGPNTGRIAAAAAQVSVSDTRNGVTLTLDSIAQMADHDALRVSLTATQPGSQVRTDGLRQLLLRDPAEHPVPFINQRIYDPPAVTVMTFSSQRLAPGTAYTLTLAGPVELAKPIPAGNPKAAFSLDLGSDPQVGQSWAVDQTVIVEGNPIHIRGVRLGLASNGTNLSFDVEPKAGISGITIEPSDPSPAVNFVGRGSTTTYWDGTTKQFLPYIQYRETPKGKLTFRVSAIDYLVGGPWMVTFQMPTFPTKP